MHNEHTLTRHRDIQSWVAQHNGVPAISRDMDEAGTIRQKLKINFRHADTKPAAGQPSLDDGISPCSWSAWLAELDRQSLALKVEANQPVYELVPRGTLN